MKTAQPDLESPLLETLTTCKQTLIDHYGDRLKALVLYGSTARETSRVESDIDLLVLLTPPIDYFKELRTVVDLLYPLQLQSSRWLSAKPAALDEFEHGINQLYRNIQQEGILL